MNSFTKFLNSITKYPCVMAFILLGLFLITTGYHFGWDDQHLEIPLLKQLIDPTLYQGDYYVESLRRNFTSFFYPILAQLITVEQIPAVYLALYLIVRYFLFYWIYKIWLHISQDPFRAFMCALVFILMARVDEFVYRTFSHQEFALAVIFAAIYFFFKERFYLAAVLLGLSTNIHALYSLFPMFFICVYLLFAVRKHSFMKLVSASMIYLLCASPFMIWSMKNRFLKGAHDPGFFKDWISVYITSCPQNFFFPKYPLIPAKILISDPKVLYHGFQGIFLLLALFILNMFFNKTFRKNGKAVAFCASAFFLVFVCFIVTYVYPIRFGLDLNLCRNTQFLLFLLMGFTTILIIDTVEKRSLLLAFCFGLFFTFIKYTNADATLSTLLMILTLSAASLQKQPVSKRKHLLLTLTVFLIVLCVWPLFRSLSNTEFKFFIRLNFFIICCLIVANYLYLRIQKKGGGTLFERRLFVVIPICVFLFQFTYYHVERYQMLHADTGFWRLQNNWEDMQRFVKENTPKDALILVPYNMEMGGFRIQSERKIICSYRDCGIVGFDYGAALEWRRRVKDIKEFKYNPSEPTKPAIITAIEKYQANYIVFMRYAAPNEDNSIFQRIYTNSDFVLFEIKGQTPF
ncbi:MAG: hypothetical protein KC713_07680 [Candidatus Omnitrophica bacterium]|nr:hypothetical protein [Candidatus Omnitrophota bacterium]